MQQALIFDFDGLIVDTEWPAYCAWQDIFKRHSAHLELSDWVLCVGSGYHRFDPTVELSQQTGLEFDRALLIAEKDQIKRQQSNLAPLQPGVEQLINQARSLGWHCAVASSSSRAWVKGHLIRHEIFSQFDTVVTKEQVTAIKPAPDLFLKTAQILQVRPEDCVVLEDSVNGIEAAISANMTAIAVPNRVTQALDFSAAHQRCDSLCQVDLQLYHATT